jgi:hypothetical protein
MAVLHLSKSPVVIVVAQASLQECAAGQASARGSLVDSPEAIALGARHLYWLPLHYGPYKSALAVAWRRRTGSTHSSKSPSAS